MSLKPNKRGKDFWGPPIWRLGHIYGITYDRSKAIEFENFWLLLCMLLPCEYCKKNLTSKMNKCCIKNYLGNKGNAFFYTYHIHDLANQHINQYQPETPKISPDYDFIKEWYTINSKNEKFWKGAFWDTLFILAATLKSQYGPAFNKFLWTSSSLLPSSSFSELFQACMRKHPPEEYMRNHNDAFFYIYLLYDCTSERPGMVPVFDDLRAYYFNALGAECNECSV